jgi:hypothetical protein
MEYFSRLVQALLSVTQRQQADATVTRVTILLTEYSAAQLEVERESRRLWTTAQILLPLSLAGVGLLALGDNHDWQSVATVAGAGLVSSLLLCEWLRIADRWWFYHGVAEERMLEIERELGMWLRRYHKTAAEASRNSKWLESAKGLSVQERQRFKRLLRARKPPSSRGTRGIVRGMVWVIMVAWILLALREVAFVTGVS